MASSFYRFARRSLPPTAAASTATAFVAVSLSKNDNKNSDIDGPSNNDAVGNVHLSCIELQSSRLFSNTPYTASFYSPPFFNTTKPVAICEAPPPAAPSPKVEHQHPAPVKNVASYKPTDPAEPVVAYPTVEITNSDGKKVQMKGGMWGEDHDGLVSGNVMCLCLT